MTRERTPYIIKCNRNLQKKEESIVVEREEILSIEFLKKADCYTGSKEGIRYRLKKKKVDENTLLEACVWEEPYNFLNTSEDKKQYQDFDFSEDGILDAIRWFNQILFEK